MTYILTTKDFDKLEKNKLSENYQPVSELAESYSFSKLSSSSRKWRSLMSFPWKKSILIEPLKNTVLSKRSSLPVFCLRNTGPLMPQRICYSHWANGAWNGVISIGQWDVFNHEKGAIWQSHFAAQKDGVVTTIIFSNHKTYQCRLIKPPLRTLLQITRLCD